MHGNPTLTTPARHGGGRLLVSRESDLLWRSHDLPPDTDAVRVDAWEGRFIGPARGWSMLAAGACRATWDPAPPDGAFATDFVVEPRTVFSTAFQHTPDEAWLASGTWEHVPGGRGAVGGRAWLFRAGPPHGILDVVFAPADDAEPGTCFGLIARHYSHAAHLRLNCQVTVTGRTLTLVCQEAAAGPAGHRLAETTRDTSAGPVRLSWAFNGERHEICDGDTRVLEAFNAFMGGVDVVGLYADPGVAVVTAAQTTTQWVPMLTIEREAYRARIRPGNVHELALCRNDGPHRNIFWDSGIQYGHIGGSEIKFAQAARQHRTDRGPVADVVEWQGPMPKFVDQATDVRGQARGRACFYADRIVISDEVVPWTRRSVGPDIDLLGRLLDGPARIALGAGGFRDWPLPDDGSMNFIATAQPGNEVLPAAMIFPLRLGAGDPWWLLSVVALRLPAPTDVTCSLFAWQCTRGLTASHDLRVIPPVPGQTYLFEILTAWHPPAAVEQIERNVANLRDDWCRPMRVVASIGRAIEYPSDGQHPREAMDFESCFDRSTGRYVLAAEQGRVQARLDPGDVSRRAAGLTLRDLPLGDGLRCELNGRRLDPDQLAVQRSAGGETWLWLNEPIREPVTIDIRVGT